MVIANETEYLNWINGHEAKVFWSTQGQKTAGSFRFIHLLAPTILLSATDSAFSAKTVSAETSLSYQQSRVF